MANQVERSKNDDLIISMQRIKNLQNIARETVSPFNKVKLAEQAIEEVVEILDELVKRAVSNG